MMSPAHPHCIECNKDVNFFEKHTISSFAKLRRNESLSLSMCPRCGTDADPAGRQEPPPAYIEFEGRRSRQPIGSESGTGNVTRIRPQSSEDASKIRKGGNDEDEVQVNPNSGCILGDTTKDKHNDPVRDPNSRENSRSPSPSPSLSSTSSMSGVSSSPSDSTQWDTDNAGSSSDGDSSFSSVEPRRGLNKRSLGKQTLYNRERDAILVRGAWRPPREEEWEFDGPVPLTLQ